MAFLCEQPDQPDSFFFLVCFSLITPNTHSNSDFIDGYEKFCNTSKRLSSLLFELQRDHLQQFLVTWTMLNKRMYQRHCYVILKQYVTDCIIDMQLSEKPEDTDGWAHRLIRFDEEMDEVTEAWTESWTLLQDYHNSEEDSLRRNRLACVQQMLKRVRDSNFDLAPYEKVIKQDRATKMQWIKLESREEAWASAISYLKRNWLEKDEARLYTVVQNENCATDQKSGNPIVNLLPNAKELNDKKHSPFVHNSNVAADESEHKCRVNATAHCSKCDCLTCSFGGPAIDERWIIPIDQRTRTQVLDMNWIECARHGKIKSTKKPDYTLANASERRLYKSLPCIDNEDETDTDNENETDSELSELQLNNHHYHLSWAVFHHLPCKCD